MYNYYGIYAACRDAAWRCLLDFGVCRLPVKVITIAKRAGIHVVKNSDVDELAGGESGVSLYDGTSWMIVYDDTLAVPESRIVIAHELGHIFLGHDYKYDEKRFEKRVGKLNIEKEADMFAVRLLAPAFVLHELHLTGAAEIAGICEIPVKIAAKRAARIRMLDTRSHYYINPLEVKLREKFDFWLAETKASRSDG